MVVQRPAQFRPLEALLLGAQISFNNAGKRKTVTRAGWMSHAMYASRVLQFQTLGICSERNCFRDEGLSQRQARKRIRKVAVSKISGLAMEGIPSRYGAHVCRPMSKLG